MPPVVHAPIFTVSAPCAGANVVHDALMRAAGVWTARTALPTFLEGDPAADPVLNGHGSHRLTATDRDAFATDPAQLLADVLIDREGRAPQDGAPVRALAGGPRLALRVQLLADAFPGARFVVSVRDPLRTLTEMLTQWRSGRYVVERGAEQWTGELPWSLPLIPDAGGLADRLVEEIVLAQWQAITTQLLDDLEALPPGAWALSDTDRLLADPRGELQRLCRFLDVEYDQALLSPVEAAARGLARVSNAPPPELAALVSRTDVLTARIGQLAPAPRPMAVASAGGTQPASAAASSPFASSSTLSVARMLRNMRSSLLISTYQSGKLICARERDRFLNTHFRDFDKPMGIAVGPERFALATRTEVWDFRDLPAVAPKLDPPGHDACYLPRNRHVTGDALMHELAFAGGELWGVATRFSCLVTFDADNSFVPRWRPSWISAIAAGDRCHLNGLAVVDERVAYVTALGTGDTPGSWREHKADGGVLVDVASGEIVVGGLSMPHSPRMHDGRMYVLESGRGELVAVDLEAGTRETVVELPGFTRGFALAGRFAFIGLSQIRESSTFGDLPLTQRLSERVCGVWAVDLVKGTIAGFLRFEDYVQEIFDVALLRGVRFPEIADPLSSATSESFAVP